MIRSYKHRFQGLAFQPLLRPGDTQQNPFGNFDPSEASPKIRGKRGLHVRGFFPPPG